MTDGPTGIQVAPTEDEMNQVQEILKRAISAVVGMSQLQADVDMLRNTVAGLQSDTERLRQQNAGLDEALYQSRTARNDLTTRLAQAEKDRDTITLERDNAQKAITISEALLSDIQAKLFDAEHGRDDAQLRVMELEDELKDVNAKLAKVKELFAPEPEPERKPTPIEPVSPVGQSVPNPAPAPIEPAAPTRHYLDAWTAGAMWDAESNRYYTES